MRTFVVNRNINKKFNRVQERALRVPYKDNTSLTEIYKTRNQFNPSYMMEIVEKKALSYQL